MFCHNCGKELVGGANFCPHCGTKSLAASQGALQAEAAGTQNLPALVSPPDAERKARELLEKAQAAYENEQIQQAVSFLTEALVLCPDDVVLRTSRGNMYAEIDEYAAACADYTLALEHAADGEQSADIYYQRGCAYAGMDNYERAFEDLNEAIRLNPSNSAYYHYRGLMYRIGTDDSAKAIWDFSEALRLDPSNADCYYRRGKTYYEMEDYDKAFPDYNEALRLDSSEAEYFYGRGMAYSAVQNYKKALSDFNSAIKLDSSVAQHYFDRAFAYWGLEDGERAVKDFKRAAELEPENKDFAKALRKARKVLREIRQAEAEADYEPPARRQGGQTGVQSGGSGIDWGNTLLTLGGAFAGGFLSGLLSDDED